MRYLIGFLFLTGCFQHWERPSSKLASRVDTYLDNDGYLLLADACDNLYRQKRCFDVFGGNLEKRNEIESFVACLKETQFYSPSPEKLKAVLSPEQVRKLTTNTLRYNRQIEVCKSTQCLADAVETFFSVHLKIYTEIFPGCSERA